MSTIMLIPGLIEALGKKLQWALPGIEAQKKMAPVPRSIPPFAATEKNATPSAVLILLFPKNDSWSFILTERSSQVEHHQGQVSLPGGAQEDGESLQETALRETEEELGIDIENVSVLGPLTPLFIPMSGFIVHPFVGWTKSQPEIQPDPVEVIAVPIVSIDQLLAPENIKREKRKHRGIEVDIPFFDFEKAKVWGATAMILSEFREILHSVVST